MSKIPRPSGKELLNILSSYGFEVVRIKGSHHFIKHPDGRCSIVPVHRNRTLGIGVLQKILKDCKISVSEFSNKKPNGKVRTE